MSTAVQKKNPWSFRRRMRITTTALVAVAGLALLLELDHERLDPTPRPPRDPKRMPQRKIKMKDCEFHRPSLTTESV